MSKQIAKQTIPNLTPNNKWFEQLLPTVLVREIDVLCASCAQMILAAVMVGDTSWVTHERCATEWQRIRLEFANAIIAKHPESLYQ